MREDRANSSLTKLALTHWRGNLILGLVTFAFGIALLLATAGTDRYTTFEVTDAGLAALAESKVPAPLLQKLAPLKGIRVTGREQFESLLFFTTKQDSSRLDAIVTASRSGPSRIAFATGIFLIFTGLLMVAVWFLERRREMIGETPEFDFPIYVNQEKERRKEERKKAQLFRENIGRRFVVRQITIGNLDFYADFSWALQPGMNVLLGRNGYGKSHLLRGLVAGLQWDEAKVREFCQSAAASPTMRIELERDKELVTIECEGGIVQQSCGKVPLLAIPDARFIDRSSTTLTVIHDERGDLKADGAYYFLYQKPYDAPLCRFLNDICGEYFRKRKRFKPPVFQLVRRIVRELTDGSFDFASVEDLEQGAYRLLVYTDGNEEHPLPIQAASQGTLSIIAVFGQIFAFLRSVFPEVAESDLFSQPAIIFIDEIDAHLHPVWQQKILHLLRQNFPAVQFLVTAHSPLVVAGCRDGEVAVLQRTQERRFKVQPIAHDFIGWGPDEIYREVFGIEDKDKAYDYYTSLEPQRSQLEEEYGRLRSASKLSQKDEERLRQIANDLYYLDRVRKKRMQELEFRELKRENNRQQFQKEKLEKEADESGSLADTD